MENLIIICANTDFDDNPLGAKPLAVTLSKKNSVIYIDPPFSVATAIKQKYLRKKIFSSRSSNISGSFLRISPMVLPGKDRKFIYKITSFLLRKKIRTSIKKMKKGTIKFSSKPVLIATAPHYEVFGKNYYNIFWMMDDYAIQPELTGIDATVLTTGQQYQCNNADKIVTVSNELTKIVDDKNKKKVVEIPNGANSDLFRFPAHKGNLLNTLPTIPETNFALYVGGINKRVDLDFLQAVSEDGIELVLAGQMSGDIDKNQFEKICSLENVKYLGALQNDLVPWLMNKATVGLVPYRNSEFNRASMPLKIPEYLMCGLQVVSTDLPFTQVFETDDVKRANTCEDFVKETRNILNNPAFPSQRVMRSSRIAQDWSWESKMEEFIQPLK